MFMEIGKTERRHTKAGPHFVSVCIILKERSPGCAEMVQVLERFMRNTAEKLAATKEKMQIIAETPL